MKYISLSLLLSQSNVAWPFLSRLQTSLAQCLLELYYLFLLRGKLELILAQNEKQNKASEIELILCLRVALECSELLSIVGDTALLQNNKK